MKLRARHAANSDIRERWTISAALLSALLFATPVALAQASGIELSGGASSLLVLGPLSGRARAAIDATLSGPVAEQYPGIGVDFASGLWVELTILQIGVRLQLTRPFAVKWSLTHALYLLRHDAAVGRTALSARAGRARTSSRQ